MTSSLQPNYFMISVKTQTNVQNLSRLRHHWRNDVILGLPQRHLCDVISL